MSLHALCTPRPSVFAADRRATVLSLDTFHNRGDHFEVELLALPKTNVIVIRYTADGSSPTSSGAATYDGPFRVPPNSRVVCAQAVAQAYGISSDVVLISIPQKGEEAAKIDPNLPATWKQQTKLDDSAAVWDFIQRLEKASHIIAFDVGLTAESADGQQNLEYSGALEGGYGPGALRDIAEKLQTIVTEGRLRMNVGCLGFPTGQALLDWLKETKQPLNPAKVAQ